MINRALGVENKQYQFLQRDHNICYRMVVFAFTLVAKNLSYSHQKVCSDIGLNNELREVRTVLQSPKFEKISTVHPISQKQFSILFRRIFAAIFTIYQASTGAI